LGSHKTPVRQLCQCERDSGPHLCHEGRLWSSGGVTAGIGLAPALIDSDFGSEVAFGGRPLSRRFLKRAGEQS
jgi:transcriptional regulator GlxA family with amidase domain